MKPFRTGLPVALGVLFFLTQPAGAQTSTAPPVMSSSWRQIRTPDFTVVGSASSGALKNTARALHTFRGALKTLFPNSRQTSATPTWVVVLEDFKAFQRFQPLDGRGKRMENVGGYFNSEPDANYLVLPAGEGADYRVVFHEYVHHFVHQNVHTPVPNWLNEGLAEFYATFEPDYKGRALLGAPPADRIRWLRGVTYMPLREIVSPRNMEEMWRSDRIATYYAESWALVHYLMVGRKDPGLGIAKYVLALAETDSQDEAFKAAFGVDVAGMDRELRAYVRLVSFNGLAIPKTSLADEEVAVTPMPEADARRLQGVLLHTLDEDDAEKELRRALAVEPNHVGARTALGRLRLRQQRDEEGVSILQEVSASAPADFASHYYLGNALARLWRHQEALAAFDKAVEANRRSPYGWLALSESALALGRDAQASATLRIATQLEANPWFYASYARRAFGLGRNAAASANVRRYLDEAGLADTGAQYIAFLGAIADLRDGLPDQAETLLKETEKAIAPNTWRATVLRFLQGKIEPDAFLAKAADLGERTEAHAYIGLILDIAGKRDEAIRHLRWVVSEGARNYTEYELARAELQRFERGASTPAP